MRVSPIFWNKIGCCSTCDSDSISEWDWSSILYGYYIDPGPHIKATHFCRLLADDGVTYYLYFLCYTGDASVIVSDDY